MPDYYINIPLNSDQSSRLENMGLNSHIQDINDKKYVSVCMTSKEQKKIIKGFPEVTFDAQNSCVLPDAANEILVSLIEEMQTLDIMKVGIMKIYNPLAGRDVFGRGTGCR